MREYYITMATKLPDMIERETEIEELIDDLRTLGKNTMEHESRLRQVRKDRQAIQQLLIKRGVSV